MPIELAATSESTATSEGIYYYLVKTNKNDLLPKLLYYPQFYSLDRFTNKRRRITRDFQGRQRYYNQLSNMVIQLGMVGQLIIGVQSGIAMKLGLRNAVILN